MVANMKQYLVCLKSESFPGVFKIVLTKEEPNELRNRMNADEVAPFPMVIDFAKEIEVTQETMGSLDVMLASVGQRYGTIPGWWKVSWDFIAALFAFHAGEWCTIYPDKHTCANDAPLHVDQETKSDVPEYKSDDDSDDDIDHALSIGNKFPIRKTCNGYSRTMWQCFYDGQIIHHQGSLSSVWEGYYDASTNMIIREGISYGTPSAFSKAHYKAFSIPRKTGQSNGWNECEYLSAISGWTKIGKFKHCARVS